MEILKKEKFWLIAAAVFLFLALAVAAQFSSPNISDPDAFYHIAHAKIYREQGLTDSSFPWAQFSVIKNIGADIWYGFHIFLTPFTLFSNPILGIKIAGAFITFATLLLFFWALKRLKIALPALWPIMLMASAPDLLYRLTMTRPHNLSLGLGLLLFSFFIEGSTWGLFIISAALAFLHLALAWLPILIALVLSLVRKLIQKTIDWRKIAAVLSGVVVGLMLRPNPLGALKLVYIQVVELLTAKLNNVPLQFGRELKNLDVAAFSQQLLPILIILIPVLVLFFGLVYKKIRLGLENQTAVGALWSSLALVVILLAITIFIARRGYDSLLGYATMATALVVTLAQPKRKLILALAGLTIVLMSLNSIPLFNTYFARSWSPGYLKEASLWLKENTKPGEIVFNTRWDYFGGLFFWNQSNYYINGMDPIFQYSFNPSLYWKYHFLAIDVADKYTCGAIRCTQETAEETHRVLVNDFKASYIFLRKIQNPKLYFYLEKIGTFPKVFDNDQEVVFKVPPL